MPYKHSIKHDPVPHRVKQSLVIFDTRALLHSSLSVQSARISKKINDGLTKTGTVCFR